MNNKLSPIKNYEGIYSITRDGRILGHERMVNTINKSKRKIVGKWLKPQKRRDNYLQIELSKNGKRMRKYIHRLVAQTYIPNIESKPQINHKNGIKTDNCVENLEWVTHQENAIHAGLNGLICGEKNGFSKLTWKQVNEIRNNHIKKGIMKRKPWKKYKISIVHYYNIVNNRNWKKKLLKEDDK